MWSLDQSGVFDGAVLNRGGFPLAWQFARAALHPELGAGVAKLVLDSTLTTLAFAVAGTALSIVLGGALGILSSEVFWELVLPARGARRPVRDRAPLLGLRAALSVPRAIHEVIWGLFFINILGLDPMVAVLAIGLPFGAITARVFASILDEAPRDAMRALEHSGAGPAKALLYGLLPQAFPDLLSYTFYRFECAIRSAAVLGLIGAGGLGYQILLSLQSLRYEQVWTFLYALIALSAWSDAWSSFLRRRLHLANRIDLKIDLHATAGRRDYRVDPVARRSLQATLLLIPWAFWYIEADLGRLVAPRTLHLLAGVIHDALPPRMDWALIKSLVPLAAQTLSMSILAMALAGVGGLVLSFPAAASFMLPGGIDDHGGGGRARVVRGALCLVASRGVLLVLRALSEAIWALVALFFLFPGILPGALGLGLYNLGICGRLMAEVNENVDPRALRALRAQGATLPQVVLYGVLPATLPRCLAYLLYRWEVCIRATVMVGFVGAGGLGRLLTEQMNSFDYRSLATSLLAMIALTFGVDSLSARIRRTLRG
ncbi:MAG TPA: ABC transporter permease subunit [Kofleriaceae bacterium]|nr:ABC transporter permease subunit [Kofleriaceae bacterium]